MPHIQINLDSDDLRNPSRLAQLASMFQSLEASVSGTTNVVARSVVVGRPIPAGAPIVPDDNPAAGIPAPSEAFKGNAQAVQTADTATAPASSIPSPTSAPASVPLPSPAAAFAPLAPAPQPGAPALPPVTPTTSQPGAIVPPPVSPIPPAPAPVPAAAPAPAGSTSPAVELDAEGLPWDVRIHSSSKEKVANGTWKLKRGVGNQVVWLNQIKDELRRALGNAPAVPTAAPNPAWPFPVPSTTVSPPATPAPAASDAGTITMARLLPRVTAALDQGRLTADQAGQICAQVSGGAVTNVAMLAVRPDLIPHVWGQLDAMGIPQ